MPGLALVGYLQIIPQHLFIVGMGTVLYNCLSTFHRALTTQVGYSLFGDDDIDRMFGTIELIQPPLAVDGQEKMEI